MEESTKKPIMIGIAVIVIIIAGILTFKRSGGSGGSFDGLKQGEKTVLLKCSEPSCGHAFEMDMREYFEWVQKKSPPRSLTAPPFACPKCGEETAYRALKDEETG